MADRRMKTLKDSIYRAADMLRSGAYLVVVDYRLDFFLRYADILFKQQAQLSASATHKKRTAGGCCYGK